jgi:hypothetical protein
MAHLQIKELAEEENKAIVTKAVQEGQQRLLEG